MQTNTLPMQSIESEMAVLGGIFCDNSAMDTVHGIIKADDFHQEKHRQIFCAMASLDDRREPIDLVSVTTALKAAGKLEDAGGGAYLYTLVEYVPTSANIAYYCRTVKDRANERRLLEIAQKVQAMLYEGKDAYEAQSLLESALYGQEHKSSDPVTAQEAMRDSIKKLEKRYEHKGEIQGIPYGLPSLDEVTNGMHRGELIVVAGRPSMGKSAFAGNIIEGVCSLGLSALLFTLEMSHSDIMDRMVASKGSVRYHGLRSGRIFDNEWPKIAQAASKIHDWKLSIDDTAAISLREIRSKAKRAKRHGLDVIVVDYLQLMSVNSRDNRVQAIGEISRGLKQLAREIDVSMVLLSQLSRAVDGRNDKRPLMSDLRDSGEIEQDADVILFPFRPAAYCQECKDKVDNENHSYSDHQMKAEIIIEKQRNGERNISLPVAWFGEYQRFVDLS